MLGDSPCGNMWYLWTLFILSAIALIVHKFKYWLPCLVVVGIYIALIRGINSANIIYGIDRIMQMQIWFALGMLWKKYYKKIALLFVIRFRSISICLVSLSLHLITLYLLSNIENTVLQNGVGLCGTLFAIAFCYSLSLIIAKLQISRLLSFFGKESMTFYVLSYFVQTPLVAVYTRVGQMGIPHTVWVLALFFGAIIFSYLFSTLLIRKNNLLKLMMLGEN